jgi:hypothetical protein
MPSLTIALMYGSLLKSDQVGDLAQVSVTSSPGVMDLFDKPLSSAHGVNLLPGFFLDLRISRNC